ncbi:MAG: hypothetical protein M0Z30_03315 [Actinomycetota bacterium]|nr:hypothetical protein [Actinomycetota bacterium]
MIPFAFGPVFVTGISTAYATNGDTHCPNSAGANTWASDGCEDGVPLYAIEAYVPENPNGVDVSRVAGDYLREKVSMYSGNPCNQWMEGGNEYYQSGSIGQESAATWIDMHDPINGYLELAYSGPASQDVTVWWYQGTSQFGVGFGSNANPASPAYTDPYVGNGACIAESGSFINDYHNSLSNIVEGTNTTSGLNLWKPGVGGIYSHTWNNYVVNQPCQPGSGYCLNGVFPNGNQSEWSFNVGYHS